MHVRLRLALVTALAGGLAASVAAQTPTRPAAMPPTRPAAPSVTPPPTPTELPTPTASQSAAAKELFQSMKLPQLMGTMEMAMVDAQIARNPGMEPYRDVLVGWLKKWMTWEAMEPDLIKLYAATFTESEMKQLGRFYRTEIGQKSLSKVPELLQKGNQIGARLGQAHSDELAALIKARKAELDKEKAEAAAGPTPEVEPTATPKRP